MPSAMNVRVATADRGERRPSPQTPCPLVHPPPMRVPMPTSNPLMATIHMGVRDGSGSGCPSAKCVTPPPNNKPIKKTQRHERSGPATAPQITPLIPAMRPMDNRSHMAEAPSNSPPVRGRINCSKDKTLSCRSLGMRAAARF